jgi:DNA-binding NarL/FixJ family response regulator
MARPLVLSAQKSGSGSEPTEAGRAKRIRVVLADDNVPFLESTTQALAPVFDVVGTAMDGRTLLDVVARLDPDVVVLDITMPGLDGLEAARKLAERGSRARIVFLTVHEDPDYLREALATGALGYVIKSRLGSDLARAIHEALAGRRFVSASPILGIRSGRRDGEA